jgi:hypothetical protein
MHPKPVDTQRSKPLDAFRQLIQNNPHLNDFSRSYTENELFRWGNFEGKFVKKPSSSTLGTFRKTRHDFFHPSFTKISLYL